MYCITKISDNRDGHEKVVALHLAGKEQNQHLLYLYVLRSSCIAISLMPRETKVNLCSKIVKMAGVGCYCRSLPLSPLLIECKTVMVTGIVAPGNIRNWLVTSIRDKIYINEILSSLQM
jgi:hypothetical protein